MPCEYGKIGFQNTKTGPVVIAMSKGSYGVFDLDGNNLVECAFNSILCSEYYDCCIVTNYLGKEGVVGFDNQIIIPVEYEDVRYNTGSHDVINKELYNSFLVNYGNDWITLYSQDGEPLESFDSYMVETTTLGDYVIYICYSNGKVFAKNLKTGKEEFVWQCPLNLETGKLSYSYRDSSPYSNFFGSGPVYIDPATGNRYQTICIDSHIENQVGGVVYSDTMFELLFRITDDGISCIDISDTFHENERRIGFYYDDRICVFPRNSEIRIFQGWPNSESGFSGITLNKPYTDFEKCIMLYSGMVLYNNGYYSIIDYDGKDLLAVDGLSDITLVGTSEYQGLYLLSFSNGKSSLINCYGQEVIPVGSQSITVLSPLSDRDYGAESRSYMTMIDYRMIVLDDKWAMYSLNDHRFITEFKDTDGSESEFYHSFCNDDGYYVLGSEDKSIFYSVSSSDAGYKVSVFFEAQN